MNKKILIKAGAFSGIVCVTALGVGLFPWLESVYAKQAVNPNPIVKVQSPREKPQVEVVFVLDTTGSMGGLIETAKEKIWSIASSMASADPAPDIKIGLVAYRDRGDAYVTQVTDLSSDLDSVYATLMQFQAQGGGDGPESVNKALFDAVNQISWSNNSNTYKTIFLVGDAPPHMDYPDEVQYPQTLAIAKNKSIVVNTIQCGEAGDTQHQWQQIAQLASGQFFNVAQNGGGIRIETPFDQQIAALSKELETTKLYFGEEKDRVLQAKKGAAIEEVFATSSTATIARRAAFNASGSGAKNFVGEKELIDTVVSGDSVDHDQLSKIPETQLPQPLRPLAPKEREEYIEAKAKQRQELNQRIRDLSDKRQQFIAEEVAKSDDGKESLDEQIYDVIKKQGEKAGLNYSGESAAY